MLAQQQSDPLASYYVSRIPNHRPFEKTPQKKCFKDVIAAST